MALTVGLFTLAAVMFGIMMAINNVVKEDKKA